ncbi:PAS domain-containing protein, partial [Sphingobium sp. Sx8-8]|uniref:PAS domain-containing protein n=1 Tax=Sphingobium sp. Sx8-8 TaxID=2933617 RepID=UPI001F584D64
MRIRAIPREHSEGAWHCRTAGKLHEEVGQDGDFGTTGGEGNVIAADFGDGMCTAGPDQATGAAPIGRARFLHAVISSIPDFVYAFDPQRRFAYANPAMLGLFGLSADQMLGKSFADLG